jgi:hypothetical protein
MCRASFDEKISKRIDNMWATHKNRMDKGLGGTYSASGYHENMG